MIKGEIFTDEIIIGKRWDKKETKQFTFMRLTGDKVNYTFNLDMLFPMTQKQLKLFDKIFSEVDPECLDLLIEYLENIKSKNATIEKRKWNNLEYFVNINSHYVTWTCRPHKAA